jgi:peptidoglycan hydrolase-like protein with peptidoglycan-binding domain
LVLGSGTAVAIAGAVAAFIGLGAAAYAVDGPAVIHAQIATAELPATASVPPRKGLKPFVSVVGPKAPSTKGANPKTTAKHEVNQQTKTGSALGGLCATAERQREVETALSSLVPYRNVSVDGRQSPSDCAIIRAFQRRFGVEPVDGRADTTTADVARRIAASSTRHRLARCGATAGVTACVDLTLQTVWVVRDGALVLGPTVVRTGFRGYTTPVGTYRINKREPQEWSDPYEVWLPYWQRFIGGIGFHETTSYLHDATLGSHGCVNLLQGDAVEMWNLLSLDSTVRTFGRRPGT